MQFFNYFFFFMRGSPKRDFVRFKFQGQFCSQNIANLVSMLTHPDR